MGKARLYCNNKNRSNEHKTRYCSKTQKFGIIDKDGNTVLPFEYIKINDIHSENIIDVQISPRKCGLYNIKEKCFVGKFQRIDLLMDNELISVSKGENENGIVNQLGEVIIPFEYYDTAYFPIVAKGQILIGNYRYK